MANNKQVANFFNKELIRCVKTDESGETVVKYLSPFVVKSEFLFERTGFKPDDPNLDEKLGIKPMEYVAPEPSAVEFLKENTDSTSEVPTDVNYKGDIKQTPEVSALIERFDDPGIPRKKRKRFTKIKIHHAD